MASLLAGKNFFDFTYSLIILLMLIGAIMPMNPNMPTSGLDPSWVYGMNVAVSEGLRFGQDIIFTFGPYASVSTKQYHPDVFHLTIIGSAFITLGLLFIVLKLSEYKMWSQGAMFLVCLTLLSFSCFLDTTVFLYCVLISIYLVKNRLKQIGYGQSPVLASEDIAFLAFIPPSLAVMFLIKGTYLILTIVMVAFYTIYLLLYKRTKLGLLIPVLFVASIILFWVTSGNLVSSIAEHVAAMLPIVSGYTDAMTIYGQSADIIAYLFIGLLLLIYVGYILRFDQVSAVFLVLSISAALFIAYKGAFVRHDAHALIASPLPFMLCGSLFSIRVSKHHSLALALVTFAAFAYMLLVSVQYSGSAAATNFVNNVYRNWSYALTGGLDEKRLRERFDTANFVIAQGIREVDRVLFDERLTVDIYPWDQSLLFSRNMNWHPRPIFQSYSAYTSYLADLNRQHLDSGNAPEIIIFSLKAIDSRYPMSEDGPSMPEILRSYAPVSLDEYLILKKEPITRNIVQQTVIEGVYSMGQTIVLPDDTDILYLKLDIDKTLFGTGMGLLFKSVPVYIDITLADGNKCTHRLIPSVAGSGFILSPYITNTTEFSLLFSQANLLAERSVKSFRVYADNPVFSYWSKEFTVRLDQFEYDGGHKFSKWLDVEIPTSVLPDQVNSTSLSKCAGSFDEVKFLGLHDYITVEGWAAQEIERGVTWDAVYLKLQGKSETRFLQAQRSLRPDVANHFGQSSLENAGFKLIADISELSDDYRMSLVMILDNSTFECDNIVRDLSF